MFTKFTRVRLAVIFTLILSALIFSAVKFGRISAANLDSRRSPSIIAVAGQTRSRINLSDGRELQTKYAGDESMSGELRSDRIRPLTRFRSY